MTSPVIGRLGDGPRRLHVLLTSLAILVTGSVLAALPSGAFAILLLGRGMQGVGLALLPLVMDVARDHLASDRARATLAALVVPTSMHRSSQPFDLPGAGLLGVGLSALLISISEGRGWGWISPAC